MSEDLLFNIKKFMERVVWTPSWISNGHFAVLKTRVKLGTHLTSSDAVICAYPTADDVQPWEDEKIIDVLAAFKDIRVEFTRSPWCHRNAALFLDASGHAAWFNADYCDALRVETLYGPSPMFSKPGTEAAVAYYDAPTLAEASIVIMPMRTPVDWDQVARTVAAATSVEEPSAMPFTNMEPPPDETPAAEPKERTSLAQMLMDDLADPNSDASKEIARSVKKTGADVTISVGKRSATFKGKKSKEETPGATAT
jgi:hypothetical protein